MANRGVSQVRGERFCIDQGRPGHAVRYHSARREFGFTVASSEWLSIQPGSDKLTGLASRFGAFVAERYPFALSDAVEAFDTATGGGEPKGESGIEAIRSTFRHELLERLSSRLIPSGLSETTPGVSAEHRVAMAQGELVDACDGFLRRAAIEASLTPDERREILRGMLLTRATDNRLKAFFTSGARFAMARLRFKGKDFDRSDRKPSTRQASGFAAGPRIAAPDGRWTGDVIAPVIRDLGVALAMRREAATVRMVLNAQMAKAGPPFDGKDLHIGDFEWGILPPAAPLGDLDADHCGHGDGVQA